MAGPSVAQLEYFLSAVELGSLSAAAEQHYIAQPSLSAQIRRLEQILGVSLFVRTNRRLLLTDAARLLVPHAERVVRAVEEAAAAVDPVRTMSGGTVALGTFSSAHHLLHTDLVTAFRTRHPQVTVRLISANSAAVADLVREGELEAGLVALPVQDRGLDVGPVEWTAEVVYLSAAPLPGPAPTIQDLARAALILPEVRSGDLDPTRRQLVDRAQHAGVRLRPIVEVESPQAVLELVERGVGDTVLSLPLARILGKTERLHWLSLDPPVHETFAFVTRRNAVLSPATAAMVRLARQLLQELDAAG